MAGTYPAMVVQMAPGVASTDVPTAGEWVDLSDRNVSIDTMVGRQDADSDFDAGTCTLSLDNSDGELDPDNTSGTWYGQLLPLTWFRVMGGTTSANTGVFYGQVDLNGFQLSASQHAGRVDVTLTAVDLLEQLARTYLPESVWKMTVEDLAPQSWYRLGESSGSTMTDSSGNEYHGTYPVGTTFNSRASLVPFSPDSAIAFTGRITGATVDLSAHPGAAATYPFTVAFWTDAPAITEATTSGPVFWRQTAGSGTMTVQNIGTAGSVLGAADNALTFLVNDGAGNKRNWYSPDFAFDGDPHFITVIVQDADTVTFAIDGAATGSNIYSSTGSAPAAQGTTGSQVIGDFPDAPLTMDEVLMFGSSLGGADVTALYEAGAQPWQADTTGARIERILDAINWSASMRDIDTGETSMTATELGSDALSALRAAEDAEGGQLYVEHNDGTQPLLTFRSRHSRFENWQSVATIGDGSGEVAPSAISLKDAPIANHATGQRVGGSTIVVRDATSELQYGTRTVSVSGLQVESDVEAENRAGLLVAERKDRRRSVTSVVLEPRKSTHPAWAHVFARRISEVILVKWRPPYGGTYTFPSYIEGIAQSYSPASGLTTTLYLSPVPYGVSDEPPYWLAGVSAAGVDTRPGY